MDNLSLSIFSKDGFITIKYSDGYVIKFNEKNFIDYVNYTAFKKCVYLSVIDNNPTIISDFFNTSDLLKFINNKISCYNSNDKYIIVDETETLKSFKSVNDVIEYLCNEQLEILHDLRYTQLKISNNLRSVKR